MQASVVLRRYPEQSETKALVLKAMPVRGTTKRPFTIKAMNFDHGYYNCWNPRLFDRLKIDYYRPIRIRISLKPFPRAVPITFSASVSYRTRGAYANYDGESGPCQPWLEWMLGQKIEDNTTIYVRVSRIPYKKGK